MNDLAPDIVRKALRSADNTRRLDLPTNGDVRPTLNWSAVAIPRDEGDALRWSSCPFSRGAAGDGFWSEDPVHFVLPYWIGRWARLW